MSNSENSSSGTNTQASGEGDKVAFESYQKALNEKKLAQKKLEETQARLNEFESAKKASEEAALKEKEDFKTLLSLRDKELGEVKQKYEMTNAQIMDGMKLNSFLKNLSGKLDDAYLPLVDVSSIPIDPNTNLPDMAAAQKVAKEFEQKYSKIIEKRTGVTLPNDAANGGGSIPSYDAFKSAGSAKKMKEMLSSLVAAHQNKET